MFGWTGRSLDRRRVRFTVQPTPGSVIRLGSVKRFYGSNPGSHFLNNQGVRLLILCNL
jgi:hypothetical protein